jgi:hypothetical protein
MDVLQYLGKYLSDTNYIVGICREYSKAYPQQNEPYKDKDT